MKKIFTAILLIFVFLTGCASGSQVDSSLVNDEPSSVKENVASQEAKKADSNDFESKDYIYKDSSGNTMYFYIVKSNLDKAVSLIGDALAYDSEGNLLDTCQKNIEIIGNGETSIMAFEFKGIEGIEKVECELSYSEDVYYTPVLNNISLEESVNKNNLTIEATNEGDLSAQFLEAYTLFFDKDDNVLSYDSSYIADINDELKPKATLSCQFDSEGEFEHAQCYLIARGDETEKAVKNEVSADDFSVRYFPFEAEGEDTEYFLAIKNNSDKTVEIQGNMTAYNQDNKALGAANGSIDVIASDEEIIMPFSFGSIDKIDHISYSLSFNENPVYDSVMAGLKMSKKQNSDSVEVTVENNGSKPAEYPQVYALFLGADEEVISYDLAFFTDDDNELKPGDSITNTLNAYGAYDSVELFLDARGEKEE